MKIILVVLMLISALSFSAERLRPIQGLRTIMTDETGMPLDDGFYEVTFKIYDKQRDGNLILESTESVESKNGTCDLCHERLTELEKKGYKEVWITTKIENYPESSFRLRIFLNPGK